MTKSEDKEGYIRVKEKNSVSVILFSSCV